MERPLVLTDFEDRLLALAEDEHVHYRLARPVLGTFYGRDVSFNEISAAAGRLAGLGLIRWRIRRQGCWYFSGRASESARRSCSATFTATAAGKAQLAAPRHVA